ncbi:MAG: hypothetical protein AAFN93_27480 [Bacteroidota bacterium]
MEKKRVESTDKNVLVIKPTNAKPKGFMAFLMWGLLGLSLVTFVFGGFVFIWIPLLFLFGIPKKYKKGMPISAVLDSEKITVFKFGGKEAWSIPWQDIKSIYYISHHWAMPKNIGLRLRRYENFRASLENNQKPGSLSEKWVKFNTSKPSRILTRMLAKCDAMIDYHALDRSPKEFAELLYSYMHISQLNTLNTEPTLDHEMPHEEMVGVCNDSQT